jgi:hypothetical protein
MNSEIEKAEKQRKINAIVCGDYLKSRGLVKAVYVTHSSTSESVGDGYSVSDAIACLIKECESLRADVKELRNRKIK